MKGLVVHLWERNKTFYFTRQCWWFIGKCLWCNFLLFVLKSLHIWKFVTWLQCLIKKLRDIKHHVCLLYPYIHTFNSPTQNFLTFFWHFWKNIFFLAPFSSENHDFPIMQQCKTKQLPKKFFPTYLPNQKIQDRGTANKHFFKDGLTYKYCLNNQPHDSNK